MSKQSKAEKRAALRAQGRLTGGQMVGFTLADFGGGLIYNAVSMYFLYFCTNIMLIPVSSAGILIFVAKLFDALNDIYVAAKVDRTFTAQGKARPWLKRWIIPFAVVGILMFSGSPNWSNPVKFVYALVIYMVFTFVFTATYLPYHTMLPLITTSQDDQAKIGTLSMTFTTISMSVVQLMFLPVIAAINAAGFNGEKTALCWFIVAAIYCLIGAGFFYLSYFSVHELKEYTPEEAKEELKKIDAKGKDGTFFASLKALITGNFSWIAVTVLVFAVYVMMTFNASGLTYYFTYVLERPVEDSAIYGLAGYVLMFPLMAFIPLLTRVLGRKKFIEIISVIGAVCFIVAWIFSKSYFITMICYGIGTTMIVVPAALVQPMFSATVYYSEARTGNKLEGCGMLAWSFTQKLAPAVASLLIAGGLSVAGMDTTLEVQPAAVAPMVNVIMWGVPILMYILILIFNRCYKITDEGTAADIEKCKELGLIGNTEA